AIRSRLSPIVSPRSGTGLAPCAYDPCSIEVFGSPDPSRSAFARSAAAGRVGRSRTQATRRVRAEEAPMTTTTIPHDDLVATRRRLHAAPELSMVERETAAFVAAEL